MGLRNIREFREEAVYRVGVYRERERDRERCNKLEQVD